MSTFSDNMEDLGKLKAKLSVAESMYSTLLQNSVKEVRDLQSKLSIAEKALKKYGWHHRICDLYLKGSEGFHCDCGFQEALEGRE